MRNVHAVLTGSTAILALLALAGCSKQVHPTDGDTPIIISDSSGFPRSTTPATAVPLFMQSPGPAFNSWPNDNSNGTVHEIYPTFPTFDNVAVVAGGTSTTFCQGSQKCHVKIWYEDNNNPTIFFDFDSTGNHQLVLKSTQNAFNTYTNWANANGTNIVDPTTTNIKKIEIRDTGQPTTVQCPTVCSVTINVK